MRIKQLVYLSDEDTQNLSAAVTAALLHSDDVVIPLDEGDCIVLQIDAVSGIITGWLENEEDTG